MRIQIHCPNCSQDGWVDEELAGRTVQCDCGQSIAVPAPKQRCPQAPDRAVAPAFASPPPPPAAAGPEPAGAKLKIALAVTAVVLLAAAIVVGALLARGRGPARPPPGVTAAADQPRPAPVSSTGPTEAPTQPEPQPAAPPEAVAAAPVPEKPKDNPQPVGVVKPKPAPVAEAVAKWEGFRVLKWGTVVATVPGMTVADTDGDAKIYQRLDESLAFGDAQLTGIAYATYKGRFFSVHAESKGAANWERLKRAVFDLYGEGHKVDGSADAWSWREGGAMLQLEYNRASGRAQFTLSSIRLLEEQEAEAAKKAAAPAR